MEVHASCVVLSWYVSYTRVLPGTHAHTERKNFYDPAFESWSVFDAPTQPLLNPIKETLGCREQPSVNQPHPTKIKECMLIEFCHLHSHQSTMDLDLVVVSLHVHWLTHTQLVYLLLMGILFQCKSGRFLPGGGAVCRLSDVCVCQQWNRTSERLFSFSLCLSSLYVSVRNVYRKQACFLSFSRKPWYCYS